MKKTRSAAAILAVFLLLTSCKPTPEPMPSGTRAPGQALPEQEGTAAFWHAFNPRSQAGQFLERRIEQYNRTNPDYRILNQPLGSCTALLQQLEESASDSTTPAVAWICVGASNPATEITSPGSLEAFLGEDQTEALVSGIDPEYLERVSSSAGLNAVPFNLSTPVIIYNMDLLNQSGLDSGFISSGWFELLDSAYIVLDNTEVPGIVFGLDPSWMVELMITTQGGRMLDEDNEPAFNNGEWTRPLYTLADLHELGAVSFSASASEAASALENGTVAMAVLPYDQATRFTDDAAYGAAAWPSASAAPGGLPVSGGALYILADEPGLQVAAADFIRFLIEETTNEMWVQESGMLPANQAALDLFRSSPPSDAAAAALQYLDTGSLLTDYDLDYLAVQEIFSTTLDDLVLPEFGVDRAATEAMLKLSGRMTPASP